MKTIFNEEKISFILGETEKLLDRVKITYERNESTIVAEEEKNQQMVENFIIHAKAYAVTQGVITPQEFSKSMI